MAKKAEDQWEKQTAKTACGGEFQFSINKTAQSVIGKLIDVKGGKVCKTCPYLFLCSAGVTEEIEERPEAEVRAIPVYAFTGMKIADMIVIEESALLIEVETKGGERLIFDKVTGRQTNGKNPRFANRITI